MSTAQAQYLRFYSGSQTYHRWQSYYVGNGVFWQNEFWTYQPFDADGISSGEVQSESSIQVRLPAIPVLTQEMVIALGAGRLAEIQLYEFDSLVGNNSPPSNQVLIASFLGQVTGVTTDLFTLTVELGSALSPVGVTVPPRTFTSTLIGSPCLL